MIRNVLRKWLGISLRDAEVDAIERTHFLDERVHDLEVGEVKSAVFKRLEARVYELEVGEIKSAASDAREVAALDQMAAERRQFKQALRQEETASAIREREERRLRKAAKIQSDRTRPSFTPPKIQQYLCETCITLIPKDETYRVGQGGKIQCHKCATPDTFTTGPAVDTFTNPLNWAKTPINPDILLALSESVTKNTELLGQLDKSMEQNRKLVEELAENERDRALLHLKIEDLKFETSEPCNFCGERP